ncbi:MAG TPA: hypothetical protein VH396_22055 [Chitinophagaceae bacterium]|jgi:hypothetical protein
MCNCGKKRNEYSRSNALALNNTAAVSNTSNINFEYTGKTALTVTGNITRKNYRFNYPGHIHTVDHRDVPGMIEVPVLKKVS